MEPGTYKAKISNCKVGKDKKDQLLIGLELEVSDGEGNREKFWKSLSFNGGAKKISLQILADCGWHGRTIADLVGIEHFQPVPIEVVLENEEYDGIERLKVKYINRPGGGTRGAMSKAEILAAGLNMNLASEMQAAGIEPAVCSPSDEIPFGE